MTDKSSFLDQVHAFLFTPKMGGRSLSKETQHVLSQHRMRLRQAERFTIDDNATSLICHLSHEYDKLQSWSYIARLPFDIVWFDYNVHKKLETFDTLNKLRNPYNPADTPDHMGYLMYKDGNSETRWICHSFMRVGSIIIPGLIAYLFDPEGNESMPLIRSSTWNMPTLSSIPNFPRLPADVREEERPTFTAEVAQISLKDMFIDAEYVLAGDFHFDYDSNNIKVSPWFAARGAAIIEPFWQQHASEFMSKEKLHEIVSIEIREEAGAIRWIMTMLATINGLPSNGKDDNHPGVESYLSDTKKKNITVGMRTLKPLDNHIVVIHVPRDKPVEWSSRHITKRAKNVRMKWHGVRGYYRTTEKDKGVGCRHVPILVENGKAICEKCGYLIQWIETPHGRGDPSLGIVERSYLVKGPTIVSTISKEPS